MSRVYCENYSKEFVGDSSLCNNCFEKINEVIHKTTPKFKVGDLILPKK